MDRSRKLLTEEILSVELIEAQLNRWRLKTRKAGLTAVPAFSNGVGVGFKPAPTVSLIPYLFELLKAIQIQVMFTQVVPGWQRWH
jgi:hypothetical protein